MAVSTRSPSPESPIKVSRLAPKCSPNRDNSAKLRASKRGAGILAKSHAFDHAAGDGIDILGRAAQRHADEIVAGIGTKGGRTQRGLQL